MSLQKLHSLIALSMIALAAISCKEDETETTPTLEGTLTFNAPPEFVAPGSTYTMTPSGVTHPEDKNIGYYWKVQPSNPEADTTKSYFTGLDPDTGEPSDGSFTYTFPDTLQTYTIYGYAYAAGYSYSSGYTYCTTIKGGLDGSLAGTGIDASDSKIESADGHEYYYENIDGIDWFRMNLADDSCGASYRNFEVMSDVLGRYYSYEEALDACPDGWRLPTNAEWEALCSYLGAEVPAVQYSQIGGVAAKLMANVTLNGKLLWEYWPEVGEITNSSKMSVIPAGFANLGIVSEGKYPQASFTGLYEYAAFWTSDKVAEEEGMAYYRYLVCDQPDLFIGKGDVRTFGASVRCVR